MYEPFPGGSGDGYEAHPGGGRAPGPWPHDDWFRPQPSQEPASGSHDVASEHGRGRRHRHGDHRRSDPNRTAALDYEAALLDPWATAVDLPPVHKTGWDWALITGAMFFLLDTILMADGFARPVAIGPRLLVILIWLISVAIVVLLWLRASPKFFAQSPLAQTIRAKTKLIRTAMTR